MIDRNRPRDWPRNARLTSGTTPKPSTGAVPYKGHAGRDCNHSHGMANCPRLPDRKKEGTPTILDGRASISYDANMGKRRSTKLSDQVRHAIDESGQTRYQIAKGAAIDESALAKFYNGHRGLSTNALDRIGEYLNLEITRAKPRKNER